MVETYVDSFQNAAGTWIYLLDIDTVWSETIEMIYPQQETILENFGDTYTFDYLEHYHDYTIHVVSEDQSPNRVNKGDLQELQAYLEGFIEFTPYQLQAADINEDGSVTIEDFNLLEDYLQNQGNVEIDKKWRFFDQSMDVSHFENGEDCEEFCTVLDLQEDTYKVNMIGYRLGDITDLEVEEVSFEAESIDPIISEVKEFSHHISPNPFINEFNVELKGASIGDAIFILKDQSGHSIMTQEIIVTDEVTNMNINISSHLFPGVYLYEIRTSDEVITGKLLKM